VTLFSKYISIPFALLFCVILLSCVNERNKEQISMSNHSIVLDTNFSFILSDKYDVYNSKTGLFKRNYSSGDEKSIYRYLRTWEIDKIQKYYLIFSLDTLPIIFHPRCYGILNPSDEKKIMISYMGKEKIIFDDSPWSCKNEKTSDQVRKANRFINLISNMIYNDIYGKLPDPNTLLE
jgi:hypothetical protein